MLGAAELREMDEALMEERGESCCRPEGRSPYLIPTFAVGLAMTRAVASGVKQHVSASARKH